MRIATWNINGLRARFDFLRHWLETRQPDVVGLQEVKVQDDGFPVADLQSLGYESVSHGQKGWNGVAVLSREPFRVVQRGLPGQEAFGARLITVEVAGLVFTTVYAPNGKHLGHDDFPRKLAWYDTLVEHVRSSHDPAAPAVLCGDFNICPEAIDSWNEEKLQGQIFHTEDERQRFQALLEWGYRDAFRERYPDTQAFSWWDYRGGAFHRKQGLRIDFLLATPPLLERMREISIDRDYRKKKDGLTPSDHAPVMADL